MLYFILLLVAAALAGVVAALITASSFWAWISTGLSVLALVCLAVDWFRRRSRGASSEARAADVEPDAGPAGADSEEESPAPGDDEPVAEDESAAEDDPELVELSEDGEATEMLGAAGGEPSDEVSEQAAPEESETPAATELSWAAAGTAEQGAQPDESERWADEATHHQDEIASAETASEASSSGEAASGEVSADGVAPDDAGDEESVAEAAESTSEDAPEPAATSGLPGEEQTGSSDARFVAGLKTEVLVVDESPRYHLAACGWLTERQTIPISVSEARELGFTPCARCGPDAGLLAKHRKRRKRFRAHAGR